MVKVFKHTHRYNDPPQTVLLAFYLRYPNPYAAHVLTCDVLSRTVDPITGTLRTTRLILKKGIVPRWARSWLEGFGGAGLAGGLEAWVLEESEVTHDGVEVGLRSSTRNISHARLMQIIEGTDLVPATPLRGTYHHTTAAVHSDFGGDTAFSSLIQGRIESYGAARFGVNAEKAREGMSLILNLLRDARPLPNTEEAGRTSGSFKDLLRGRGRHLFSSDEDAGGSGSASSREEEEHDGSGQDSAPFSKLSRGMSTGETSSSESPISSNPPSFFSSISRTTTGTPTSSTASPSLSSSSSAPASFFLSHSSMRTFAPSASGSRTASTSISSSSTRWRDEKLLSIRQREKSRMLEDIDPENDRPEPSGRVDPTSIGVEPDGEDTERVFSGLSVIGLGLGLAGWLRPGRKPPSAVWSHAIHRNLHLSRSRVRFSNPANTTRSPTSLIHSPTRRSIHTDLDRELNKLLKRPADYEPPRKVVPAASSWSLPSGSERQNVGTDNGISVRARKQEPGHSSPQRRSDPSSIRSRPSQNRGPSHDQPARAAKAFGFRDQVRQEKAGTMPPPRSNQRHSANVHDQTARPGRTQQQPFADRGGFDAKRAAQRGRERGVEPKTPQVTARPTESEVREASPQEDDVDDMPTNAFDGVFIDADHGRRQGRVDHRAGPTNNRRKDSRGSLTSSSQASASYNSGKRPTPTFGKPVNTTDVLKRKAKRTEAEVKVEKDVYLPLSIRVADLARLLDVKLFKLQRVMENQGLSEQECHPDNQITSDFSSLIAQEYGLNPVIDEERSFDIFPDPPPKDTTSLPSRPPVVTIMGHVDHGKTTLLDSLRHTAVAAGEAGGITQHIGAFSVSLNSMLEQSQSTSKSDATITFLDTPGHAAFSAMRARGAHVTDIVVLVVAADDGVMPQTKEVIRLVQAEGDHVGLVVAINKIDKPGIDLAKVKSALGAEGIFLEEDGGDIPSVRVSGLTGLGLVDLVETLATVAEVRDLRASRDSKAEGFVLESRIEKGRGNVATVLVARGTLKQGSSIVAGHTWCRVRQMTDDKGKIVKQAGPGMPVIVTGWRDLPTAGDDLLEASKGEDEAKKAIENRKRDQERKTLMQDVEQINEKRRVERERIEAEEKAEEALKATGQAVPATVASRNPTTSDAFKELRLVIRADVSGTVEAVIGALEHIGNKEAGVKIVHTGVGDVTEADVAMADAVEGTIIGFSVSAPRKVRDQAAAAKVDLQLEDVIYRLIETVRKKVAGLLPPIIETRVLGEAVVQQIFKIDIKGKEAATIAGCRVGNGVIGKNDTIRVLRGVDREVVHEGTLDSLKHVKKDITEAKKGSECGLSLAGWTGILDGDIVVAVQKVEKEREL